MTPSFEVGIMVSKTLPGTQAQQTVPRAELSALIDATKHFTGNITAYTDHHNIVKIMSKPKAQQLAAANADLWEELQQLLEENRKLTVKYVPSHTTAEALEKGKLTVYEYMGNALADKLASKAADANQHEDNTIASIDYVDHLAWSVQRRLIRINEHCLDNYPHPKGRKQPQKRQERKKQLRPTVLQLLRQGHDLRRRRNRYHCTRCGIQHQRRHLGKWAAQGICNAGEQQEHLHIGSQQVDSSHKMAKTAGVFWCRRCGAIGTRKLQKLAALCEEPTARGKKNLALLAKGIVPS